MGERADTQQREQAALASLPPGGEWQPYPADEWLDHALWDLARVRPDLVVEEVREFGRGMRRGYRRVIG